MYNPKDLRILVELRNDARAQLTTISKKTGIPISTIYDRLKNKSNGLIFKNVSLIDFESIGFNTRANICIKCSKTSKDKVREFLAKHQNVNSLFKINNGYDFLAEVIFKNVRDLEEFIETIEDKFIIKSKQVFYIIDNIIRESFFSDPLHLELLNSKSRF